MSMNQDCGACWALQAQLDAACDALPAELLEANDGYVYEAIKALRARVAELEAECTRRFVSTSNDGERIAQLEATLERVRAVEAALAPPDKR
jgi:hypothetical protein